MSSQTLMKLKQKIGVWIIGVACLCGGRMINAASEEPAGAVYVMSNKAHRNSVLVFQRATDGTLTFVEESFTGERERGSLLIHSCRKAPFPSPPMAECCSS